MQIDRSVLDGRGGLLGNSLIYKTERRNKNQSVRRSISSYRPPQRASGRATTWAFLFLRPNYDPLVCDFGQAGDDPALSRTQPRPGGAFFTCRAGHPRSRIRGVRRLASSPTRSAANAGSRSYTRQIWEP